MKRTAAFRFTSDICFFYAILSYFPAMLPLQESMALFAAAAFAVSLAAVYCPWAPLRFLLALLPGLAFLRAELGFLLILPAMAWLYLILVLTAGRFQIWLEEYRRSYRIMLKLFLLSFGLSVMLNMLSRGILVFLPGMAYALAFLCLGAIAMRRMQMNSDMSLRWNLANGAVVVGVPLLAIGVSLGLGLLPRSLKSFFAALSHLFAVLVSSLINWLLKVAPDVPVPTRRPFQSPSPEETEQLQEFDDSIDPEGWSWELDPTLVERLARIGVCVLFALLVLALVILILRRVRYNRVKSGEEELLFEEAEKGSPLRRRKAEKLRASSNARRIRLLYQEYMELMRDKGIKIQKYNTSREILDEAELFCVSPEARRLRELYLAARYGNAGSVTGEDVREADLCLQKIREDMPRMN